MPVYMERQFEDWFGYHLQLTSWHVELFKGENPYSFSWYVHFLTSEHILDMQTCRL
jgi:hypothetical protein